MALPRAWTEYQHDVLGFAALMGIDPQNEYRKILLRAEKMPQRLGVVTPDREITDQIVQVLAVWRMMVDPRCFVGVCHGSRREGVAWVQSVKEMILTSDESLHQELLFSEDGIAICRAGFDGWNLCICQPGTLCDVERLILKHRGTPRPIMIITDPIDLLSRERLDLVASTVVGPGNLWVCTNRHVMV